MINQFLIVEDFISDEGFQNFVLQRDGAAVAHWKAYRKNHPEQEVMISEAYHFVNLLAPHNTALTITSKPPIKKYFYLIALVACSLILFSIWFFSLSANAGEEITLIRHAETENLSLVFSDQTEVELRKGSTIKYYEDWSGTGKRKIWLEGEAYFNVSKSEKDNDVFQVIADHGIISVHGTKFLVKTDDEDLSVILEEGKVACVVGEQNIMMRPGDLLFSNKDGVSVEHLQPVRTFDSWRKGKLSFKNVSIEQVIETINNSYPIEVSLGNDQLKSRKITATVDQNDPMLLLNAIAEIYGIELIENSNKIIMK